MNTKEALEKWPDFTVQELDSFSDYFLLDTLAATTTVRSELRAAARRRSKQLEQMEKAAGTWYPTKKNHNDKRLKSPQQ
jgi:hypothetical protein